MSGMDAFVGMYNAAANKKRGQRQDAQEDIKIQELVRKARREEMDSGYGSNPDTGKIDFDPNYYTPDTPSYQRGTREAALKAQGSPRSVVAGAPLSVEQAFAIRGETLPTQLQGVKDMPFDHRYNSLFPAKAKLQETAPIEMLNDPQAFAKNNPNYRVPAPFAGSFRRPIPGDAPTFPEQQAEWAAAMGVSPSAAKGLTMRQYTSGMSAVNAQRAAGDRQGRALEQSSAQFGERMNYDKDKDLNNRVQAFQDDYKKTNIPAMLPAFRNLDKLTGILTKDKTNTAKLPGYGTNAISAIPLVGQALGNLAAKRYGGQAERQVLMSLLNTQIRDRSGQAVTKYEEGRNLLEAGMAPGGNEEDVTRGVRMMYESMLENDRSVRAGYDPAVVDTYVGRGGLAPLGPMTEQLDKKKNPSDVRGENARTQGGRKSAYMDPDIQAAIRNPKDPAARAAADQKLDRIRPNAGSVIDGYKFKGGDPGDQKNWVKVK